MEVGWPTTGLTQTFDDVPLDRVLEITEGESRLETIPLERLRLAKRTAPR